MATQAVIVSITDKAARIAYYYPVPAGQQIAAAVDPNRTPANGGLTAQEEQDLKDGKIHEYLYTVRIGGLDQPAARVKVEGLWSTLADTALADYQRRYKQAALFGKAWDGTSWS